MARRNCFNDRGSSHRGVSILEVLFAILITAIGLMGAIAVFPAAIMQAKRGQQADAAAVAGLRCIHDFDAQGMRRPDRWLAYNGSNYAVVTALDGTYGYCIDPRFVAANPNSSAANYLPYGGATGFPGTYSSAMGRVSLHNGLTGAAAGPMSALLAEMNFRIEDDLAYDRFNDKIANTDETLHAASLFVRNGATALKRESHGHMSWIATLCPKLERYPSGITFEDRYVLSIVVFYDRPVQLEAGGNYPESEWDLAVDMEGTAPDTYDRGIGGGAMLLTGTTLERVDIRKDQWIMLMGYTERTDGMGNTRRSPLCRWYRVIDADEPTGTAPNCTVVVTLAGPDWDADATTAPLPTPFFARAVVMKGVVAVYEKTIKLETRL